MAYLKTSALALIFWCVADSALAEVTDASQFHRESAGQSQLWAENVPFVLALVFAGTVLYFLPTAIAKIRKHPKILVIFVLNSLLGWTFVGWAIALAWSCMRTHGQALDGAPNMPDHCRPS